MAQAAGVSPSQPATQDAPPRTKGSVMATTLVGAHAFEHLYAHSIPIIILAIITEFELGALSVGAVVAIRSIFGGITSTAGGFLVDLFHHRVAWVLAISTLMIGTGYLLMSIAPSYILILGAIALGSMGSALWHPPALGLLARRFPERRGLFISMHRSTGSIGDVIGPLAAGALIAGALTWSGGADGAEVGVSYALPWGTVDWRYILGFSTPIMFIATVVIFILLRNAGSERPVNVDIGARVRTNWAGMKDAFRGTGMWAIFTVSAVRGMADRSLVFLVPLYLIHLGVGEFQAAVHVMLMVLPGILFGPIIGSLSDRIGRRPLIIFIMGITTMLTIAIIMVSGEGYTPWITMFVAIYGMMNFSVNNLTQAAAADIAAGRRLESSFLGLMWGNNTLFGAIAAFMIFGPVEWFDWQYGFFIAAGIYFAGFLISLMIPGKPREPEAVPAPAWLRGAFRLAAAQGTLPDAPVTGERRTGNRVLASTLIGAHGFEHLISNSIPLLTTVMAVDLGLGALQVGAIVAVRSASAGITSVTGGFLSDLLHHRIAWVLSISALLTAIGLLLIAISPSYAVILLALALASSGAALWHPPALGLLAQRFPNRRGLFLSMHRSTGSVGDVVGPMIAGILLIGALQWEASDGLVVGWELGLEPVSWRWILAFGAPIMFIATFVIYGLLRHAGDAPPVNLDVAQRLRTIGQGTYVAFRGTGLWAIFAVAAVRGMADGSMLFLVPLYLTHALGINTFQASAHLALMVGPAMVTAPLLGALSDKVGRKPLIVFLMAFATVLTLAIPLGGPQYSVWITLCVALYGLQHFTVINLTSAAAADVAARYRLESSFLGLMWGNNVLFGAVAAVFIFGPIEWLGWQYGFFIAGGIYGVGFLASLAIPGREREPAAA